MGRAIVSREVQALLVDINSDDLGCAEGLCNCLMVMVSMGIVQLQSSNTTLTPLGRRRAGSSTYHTDKTNWTSAIDDHTVAGLHSALPNDVHAYAQRLHDSALLQGDVIGPVRMRDIISKGLNHCGGIRSARIERNAA